MARRTRYSASFFALEGQRRVRLLRVLGDSRFVSPTAVGESLPLERGSPGQVILAFTGRSGPVHDLIRQRGFHVTIGEADAHAASVAAPVFGRNRTLAGAICIALPADQVDERTLARHVPAVVRSARNLSNAFNLARDGAQRLPARPRGLWQV